MSSGNSNLKKILEIDLKDQKTLESLKFLENSLQADEKISGDTLTSKLNSLFILKSRQILDHYKPIYENTHSVYKIIMPFKILKVF